MMDTASALKETADANVIEALETALPAIIMDARRAASSIVMGEHGKRRVGVGDAFWQHREWQNGETIRQIDWRRSARSDTLFVRERERQVPALLQVWCDHRAGMAWRSDTQYPTKAQRGLVMGLALAIATRAGGERVCALGPANPLNNETSFARVLAQAGQKPPQGYRPGQVVIISDGLESTDIWSARAKHCVGAHAQLIVVLVGDPAEQEFPFQGRVSFRATSGEPPVLVGRAQSAREDYIRAYQAHMAGIERAIEQAGGQVFRHATNQAAMPTLLTLASALGRDAPRKPNTAKSGAK